EGGALAPAVEQVVDDGDTVAFTVTPDAAFLVDEVEGCGGALEGSTYTTAAVFADCTVIARFIPDGAPTWVVTPDAGPGGTLSPSTPQGVEDGATVLFTVIPGKGFRIGAVDGCGGALEGTQFATAPVVADCTVVASFF